MFQRLDIDGSGVRDSKVENVEEWKNGKRLQKVVKKQPTT